MEFWDIYDENKKPTGRTMKRNDWCLKDGEYHLTVLGVVGRPDGTFLITKRVMTKAWAPGWWEVSGGAAQAGEESCEAVFREVKEETGLDITKCRYLFSIPNLYMYCGFEVHTVDMFFECHVKDFTGVHAEDDAAEIVIVKKEELKAEEFGLMSIKKAIRLYKENNC
mgnify:CR=1 FL=1